MARAVRSLLCALFTLALAGSPPVAKAAEPVDLLLVLAADVSRSVDQAKFKLQREGYAAALSHPQVVKAITSGLLGRIAVCFVEWSGPAAQKVIIDWTLIGDADAARQFSGRLLEAPRPFADRTSISEAIDFSVALFDLAPFEAPRRTIDVSGDGTNNAGRSVNAARDDAVARRIVVNGLVILTEGTPDFSYQSAHVNPPGGLENYYRQNVIGGPGAFVEVARGFDSFGEAIRKKLVTEISEVPGPGRFAARQ